MKVGILTYHRALNYGATLQAVALRTVVENLGNEAYFFNYWPSYHKSKYAVFSWYKFRKYPFKEKFFYCLNSLRMAGPRIARIRNFNTFFRSHVLPYCISPSNQEINIALFGSDQIWRKQLETGVFNPVYFGAELINAPKKVSYAASMGLLPESESEKGTLRELLSHLDSISVREQDLSLFLTELGYRDHKIVLDPTLLLPSEKWEQIVEIPNLGLGRYILVYGITAVSFSWTKVREFAARKGLGVIHLSGTASKNDDPHCYSTVGPDYFLALIRDAEYVFSSSFHGVAFSVIFKKQFFASFSNNSNRAKTLLDSLGLSSRMVSNDVFDIPEIDYTPVYDKLEKLRNDSMSFLTDSLK